jgi:hypothetical protein
MRIRFRLCQVLLAAASADSNRDLNPDPDPDEGGSPMRVLVQQMSSHGG